jgi:hypothetical protein
VVMIGVVLLMIFGLVYLVPLLVAGVLVDRS